MSATCKPLQSLLAYGDLFLLFVGAPKDLSAEASVTNVFPLGIVLHATVASAMSTVASKITDRSGLIVMNRPINTFADSGADEHQLIEHI
jgi:hypothetical protein